MTTYINVLDVFSYAAHTLANTLWSERAYTFRISSTRATSALNTLRTCLAHVLGTSLYATCAFRFYEILLQ